MLLDFSTNFFLTILCDMGGNIVKKNWLYKIILIWTISGLNFLIWRY